MEITSIFKEREHQSPLNSPSSQNGRSSTTTSYNTNGNNTIIPTTRSDPNSPYPTTFVTADTSSFKQVVQMLTGSPSESSKQPDPNTTQKQFVIPPIKTNPPKKQGVKLYERRNSLKNMISPLTPNFGPQISSSFSPRNHHYFNHHNNKNNVQELLSPSLLDFPSLTLSPVTPFGIEDPFNKSSPSINGGGSSSEEDRAIAEKGFYLHPSPRDGENPQLLPLFPLSSPRMSGPSN